MSVKISKVAMNDKIEKIKLETPYHPDLPKKARN